MKIDLHVHSKHSTRPSQWILQKLGCPESFTDPMKLYRIAKERGMDLVTISDHNTINGALEIAHLPDTFVSVEITTYFPEDRCKLHVLASNITEQQFDEIQKLRENVFELVPYLRSEDITHICAHPLYGVNDRLTVDHFEKILLMFKNLELNGARDGSPNHLLRHLVRTLTPADIERLAEKHNMEPEIPEPWLKSLTGGSDDHGALNIARIYTKVPGATNITEFLDGINRGKSQPHGMEAIPETMAHNLYAIAYQYYRNKLGLGRYVNKDIFLRFVDRFLGAEEPKTGSIVDKLQAYWTTRRYMRAKTDRKDTVQNVVRTEAAKLICDDPILKEIAKSTKPLPMGKGKEWCRFVNNATNKVCHYFGDSLLGQVAGGNVFDIFQTVGSAGALYTFLAPYFVAYTLFNQDRQFSAEVAKAFNMNEGRPERNNVRVGHFTDTFYEINGVAKTLQRSVHLAAKTGKDLTMITCSPGLHPEVPGVRNFAPVGVFDLPEYPEQKIFYPPVLEMLQYAFEKDFTVIHSATPGPIGITALLISRLFKLPIYGTYHTQIPQYAQKLTGDEQMEELTWKYTIWYYNQMDLVYAPSRATADELIEKGLPEEKVVVYPRGVDIELFNPEKRNGFLKRYNADDGINMLYVGRISKEKNLDLLADVYKEVHRKNKRLNLVLVGDGPYRKEMEKQLKGTGAIFTGYLEGEALAACYASSDLFVFPSSTDTFGNVVLEAQASGIPVVVTDSGGPCENMLDGETGMVVRANSANQLKAAIQKLTNEPSKLQEMGRNARKYMEGRSFEKAFDKTWDIYKSVKSAM